MFICSRSSVDPILKIAPEIGTDFTKYGADGPSSNIAGPPSQTGNIGFVVAKGSLPCCCNFFHHCVQFSCFKYHLHRFVLMSWAEGGERPLIMLNGSFFFSPGEDYRINGDCQLPAITIKNTFSGNNVMLDNKRKTSQEFVQIFQTRRRTTVK